MLRNLDIDRLRAIAIIAVLVNHGADFLEFMGEKSSHLLNLLKQGAAGVDLFFVISGYIVSSVIAPSISRIHKSPSANGDFKSFLWKFYLKRVFRLLPAAWVVLGIFLVAEAFLFGPQTERFYYSLNNALAAILYSGNYFLYFYPPQHYSMNIFGHYWSLAIEEQFYLVFPLFLGFIRSDRSKMILLSVILFILVFILRPLLLPSSITGLRNDAIATFATHFRADGIVAGCLLYLLSQTKIWKRFSPPAFLRNPSYSVVLTLGVFLGAMTARCFFSFSVSIPLVVMLSCVLVYLASFNQNLIAGGFRYDPILQWFGSRSYSLYLINWPLLWALQQLMITHSEDYSMLKVAGVLGVWTLSSVVLSECLYQYVECPMQRIGHRFLSKETKSKMEVTGILEKIGG